MHSSTHERKPLATTYALSVVSLERALLKWLEIWNAPEMQKFKTEIFHADPELSDYFSRTFDNNPVHLDGNSNEVLPPGTCSGLFITALASKALLALPEFHGVLCARSMDIHWKRPIFRGQHLFVQGAYKNEEHPKRPGIIKRQTECEVLCVGSKEIVMRYTVEQLVRG